MDIWGPLGDARGSGGEKVPREKFSPKIRYPKSSFPEFLEKLFLPMLWPDGGI